MIVVRHDLVHDDKSPTHVSTAGRS